MNAVRTPAGIWERLGERLESGPEPPEDGALYRHIEELADPALFRPKIADDVEVKVFKLRWGNDYAMAANPRDLIHFRLDPGEVELMKLMDGTRTVKEIVIERFQESGDLEMGGVADLVQQLYDNGFLDRKFVNVEHAVKEQIAIDAGERRRSRQFVKTLSIEWEGADRLVRWLYDHGLRWFFTKWAQVPALFVAVLGFAAFISVERSGKFSLGGRSLALASLILLGLNYLLTFVHELGHAVVLTHYSRRVKSAGFMIYFGSPTFFVESSDVQMLERVQRIVQSFAGPYAEMITAGTAAIILRLFPHGALAPVLYKFVVLNYFVLFLNLIPLLELDGYWLLSDLIQVPNLRPMSLSFMRDGMWRKLRARRRFTKQELGLAAYGIIGVLFTIFSFYTAFFFWHEIFGGLIRSLWDGGPLTRILLIALGIFVTGPVIRGGIALVRSLARRVRAAIRKIRFRLQSKWRVEAAELIDALPIFEDLPAEALSDLAGRVDLRSFPRGRAVVRQGERASAFYVVRTGILEVVEEDNVSGNERSLRTLGRGESFGELGLVDASPRTCTVRAVEDAEVFEIDKGTFDHLLADMIHVPEFAPTLQAAAELRELGPFSHLEPDELGELLAHGEWVQLSPGEVAVQEGEAGDDFFAIRSGQVEVTQRDELIRTIGPGGYFGEVALLLDIPRTATVTARTPVRAFRLDREGFDELIGGSFRRGTLKPQAGRVGQH